LLLVWLGGNFPVPVLLALLTNIKFFRWRSTWERNFFQKLVECERLYQLVYFLFILAQISRINDSNYKKTIKIDRVSFCSTSCSRLIVLPMSPFVSYQCLLMWIKKLKKQICLNFCRWLYIIIRKIIKCSHEHSQMSVVK
jgi:hypothetical protein